MCVTAYELTSTGERQTSGSGVGWRQHLQLNGSQIAAYILIASAHVLNALPENPTDVIAGVIAWRRHMADDAAADSASTHIQQPATRRVAPGSTTRNTVAIAIEHNNK